MGLRPRRVYERLNRARLDSTALELHREEMAARFRVLADFHAAWASGASPAGLATSAQAFLDFLSRIFLVPAMTLVLSDRPRPHRRDARGRVADEVHGTCTNEGTIRVYLRTARHRRPIALKTFFNTLVHEWVHHYDFAALGDTIHCSGFYERLGAIYRACVPPPKQGAGPGEEAQEGARA